MDLSLLKKLRRYLATANRMDGFWRMWRQLQDRMQDLDIFLHMSSSPRASSSMSNLTKRSSWEGPGFFLVAVLFHKCTVFCVVRFGAGVAAAAGGGAPVPTVGQITSVAMIRAVLVECWSRVTMLSVERCE